MVCEDLEVNKKMNVSSLSLKSVAEAYGLKINKDEISFREQREILLTRNGDITDLLAYGIKDVIVLRELQEKLQGVNNALILQEQW
jgi:hypothetical protein